MRRRNPNFSPQDRAENALRKALEDQESRLFAWTNAFIVLVILYSVTTAAFETVSHLYDRYAAFFQVSEQFIFVVFSLEYLARLYIARPSRGYALSVWGIIDLLAIAPSLMNLVPLQNLKVTRILRVLRFLRLMRVLKLGKVVVHDYEESRRQRRGTLRLDLQIYFMTTFSVLIIASTLVYYAEHDAQPDSFSSIPKALWWGAMILTKGGPSGMMPVTLWGRVLSVLTSVSGLALFGVLMNVVGKAMMQGLFGMQRAEPYPHDSDDAGGPRAV